MRRSAEVTGKIDKYAFNTVKKRLDQSEIDAVFEKKITWVKSQFGSDFGLVHTPTTMANYSAPSMMKHQSCRNFKTGSDS